METILLKNDRLDKHLLSIDQHLISLTSNASKSGCFFFVVTS